MPDQNKDRDLMQAGGRSYPQNGRRGATVPAEFTKSGLIPCHSGLTAFISPYKNGSCDGVLFPEAIPAFPKAWNFIPSVMIRVSPEWILGTLTSSRINRLNQTPAFFDLKQRQPRTDDKESRLKHSIESLSDFPISNHQSAITYLRQILVMSYSNQCNSMFISEF